MGSAPSIVAQSAGASDLKNKRTLASDHFNQAKKHRNSSSFQEADLHFLQAQELYQQLADWSEVVNCAIYRSQINYHLSEMDSLAQILDFAQSIMDREDLKEEHFKQERIYFFRAMYFEATAQYQSASDVLDQATTILEAIEQPIALDSSLLSSHKTLAGSIFYERKDFQSAINYYQTALSLFPVSRPAEEKMLIINNNLGLAYIEQGQVKKGMEFLNKSLSILPKFELEVSFDDYLQTYFNLIKGYLLLHQHAEAVRFLDLAKPLLDKKPDDAHIWYSLRAQLDEQLGEIEEAQKHYQLAVEARKQVRGSHHPSVAKLYLSLGRLANQLNHKQAAISALQQGLLVFDEELDQSDIFATPSLKKVNDFYLLIQLLKEKGDCLQTQFPGAINRILPTYRVAIAAIDSLRLLYESDASKLLLSKEAKAVFGATIHLLYRRYSETPDVSYLDEAFQCMEKSKALLLLENIRKWRNIRLSNTKKDSLSIRFNELLEQEKNAKLDVILLQRRLDDALKKNLGQDASQIGRLQVALQQVTAKYEKLKTVLSDNFPQYFKASYENSVASISSIRQNLLSGQETALLSYFLSKEQGFAMIISSDTTIIKVIPRQEIWQDHFDHYQKVLKAQGASLVLTKEFEQYLSSASHLYDLLLHPLLQELPEDISRLYIVPDAILGFMAFEPLLVSKPEIDQVSYSVRDLDYLLEHFDLAYGYSATLLIESLNRKSQTGQLKDYGGFAPVFKEGAIGKAVSRDCTSGNLMYLPYSEESILKTSTLYEGDPFLFEQASLDNFKSTASQYRILQLATHACIDEQDALFNVIYFHDTTLATYEIFDIPIQADVVILSACETGNGDLLQGEGIMSLSRGFYYAGGSSIVTSLWPADDFATKELMLSFNQYLRKSWPKDKALRQAKLDYLNRPGLRLSHRAPSLWANFILIGNRESIEFSGSHLFSGIWSSALGIGIVLAFGFYFYKKKK